MDEFEWDAAKAAANLKDHDVSFEEALTVFADPLAAIFDDPDHSAEERRELIIGRSTKQHLLVVGFTERAGRVRIITARKCPHESGRIMSRTPRRTSRVEAHGLRAEYAFDYSKAKPNRFAGRMGGDVVAVILEPDVASVVKSSAKANAMLRSVLATRLRKRSVRVRGHKRKAG